MKYDIILSKPCKIWHHTKNSLTDSVSNKSISNLFCEYSSVKRRHSKLLDSFIWNLRVEARFLTTMIPVEIVITKLKIMAYSQIPKGVEIAEDATVSAKVLKMRRKQQTTLQRK